MIKQLYYIKFAICTECSLVTRLSFYLYFRFAWTFCMHTLICYCALRRVTVICAFRADIIWMRNNLFITELTESRTACIFIRDTACFHCDSMNSATVALVTQLWRTDPVSLLLKTFLVKTFDCGISTPIWTIENNIDNSCATNATVALTFLIITYWIENTVATLELKRARCCQFWGK